MKNIVGDKLHLVVENITSCAENIKRFRLADKNGDELPVCAAGAHVIIEMQDGNIIRRNPYSLMGDANDRTSYSISVLRLESGRGGSRFMHDQLEKGMELTVSYPVNLFGLDFRARKHILIAGGIGITPIMAHAAALAQQMLPFEIHYIVRSQSRAAYYDELKKLYGHRFNFYIRGLNVPDDEDSLHIPTLLENQPAGTHIYICGPLPLMNSITDICKKTGWDRSSVHTEQFLAPPSGAPYTIELLRSKKTILVGEHQSMLDAIEQAGANPPYLCRGGACGQCETDVVSFDGVVSHHDHFLSDEEKESGRKIMPCVSRMEGKNARIVIER